MINARWFHTFLFVCEVICVCFHKVTCNTEMQLPNTWKMTVLLVHYQRWTLNGIMLKLTNFCRTAWINRTHCAIIHLDKTPNSSKFWTWRLHKGPEKWDRTQGCATLQCARAWQCVNSSNFNMKENLTSHLDHGLL